MNRLEDSELCLAVTPHTDSEILKRRLKVIPKSQNNRLPKYVRLYTSDQIKLLRRKI